MITGTVNAQYLATVTLALYDILGQSREIEAALDTGFSEFLLLPSELVRELGLPFVDRDRVTLADGSEKVLPLCGAVLDWDGQMIPVYAHVSDGPPLIGMSMLVGYNVNMDVEVGGRVTIRAKGDEERG